MKKICIVTASEMTIRAFWIEHIRQLSALYEVTVVTNTGEPDFLKEYGLNVSVHPIKIQREISIVADLRALWKLYLFFRSHKFDLVHSVTPKAGLLSMVAARVAGIKKRVHTFTGQVWANKRGFKRMLLKQFDRLIVLFSSDLLADSDSQKQFLVSQKVARTDNLDVLAFGSISGVDLERFKPDDLRREQIRQDLKISPTQVVLLFLGRLNRDKGVLDLANAFKEICAETDAVMLFVGPDEGQMKQAIQDICRDCPNTLKFVGYTDAPESYMAASDIFCLPSYREGFGSVIIEAAVSGIPAIASRIYGITDAVDEGNTGELFPPGDFKALAELMEKYITNENTRKQAGNAAMQRANELFSAEYVTKALITYYRDKLELTED